MKKITVLLNKAWTESDEFKKLPLRHLEKQIRSNPEVVLVASNRARMVFLIDDEAEDAFTKMVFEIVARDYNPVNVGKCISISSEDVEEEFEVEIPLSFSESADDVNASAAGKESAEDKCDADSSQEETVDTLPYDFEALLDDAPMKHSEDLKNYLRETKAVIPMLKQMDNEACIWSQNLLVSIDTGFGLTTFLQTLTKVHILDGLVENREDVSYYFDEVSVEADEKGAWEKLINVADSCESRAEKAKQTILCIDVSEYIDDIIEGKLVNDLKQLADISKHYICVFRVPYMEHSVVNDIAIALSDVMNIKTLCVPPVHIEDMVDYMRNRLQKKGIESDDSCNEMLERQLLKEKSDDSFFGYKTLNKVIDKVIYDKAVKNANSGIISKRIEHDDIVIPNYEVTGFNPSESLRELVGMDNIMEQIDMIVAQMTELKNQREKGIEIEKPSIHMMFTGNPGTGKTTVARMVAKILKQKGILRKGHVFEYKGRDLCGRYIGETAPKTSAICRDAYGSVLFIDEAYSLFRGESASERDYGREALDTLVAEMENHRDDMCIILAGYTDEMNTMLEGNRGLRSRIPYIIDFPNYTREQLGDIFFKMLGNKFAYDNEFELAVKDFFTELPDSVFESKQFSNARFVRNLYEKIWGKAAYRKSMNNEEELVLLKSDLENAANSDEYKYLLEKKNKKTIGFI